MSTGFQIVGPTDVEIQAYMADTGSDLESATRALQLKSALQAVDDAADLADMKKIVKLIIRRLVPLL